MYHTNGNSNLLSRQDSFRANCREAFTEILRKYYLMLRKVLSFHFTCTVPSAIFRCAIALIPSKGLSGTRPTIHAGIWVTQVKFFVTEMQCHVSQCLFKHASGNGKSNFVNCGTSRGPHICYVVFFDIGDSVSC